MPVHAPQDGENAAKSRFDIDQLKSWFQDYISSDSESLQADDPVIQAVESDELEYDMVEAHVRKLIPSANVEEGFCYQCRRLLEHWPELGEYEHCVGRQCRTDEIEAATRAGCKFCAFLLSRLKFKGLLDTFRRIERRLQLLDDTGTASLSIREVIDFEWLWLNFPGKVATRCDLPGRDVFESCIISPTGQYDNSSSETSLNISNLQSQPVAR